MDKLIDSLSGRKTYLVAALGFVVTILRAFDVLDNEAYTLLMSFLGFGGIAAARAGVAKLGAKKKKK